MDNNQLAEKMIEKSIEAFTMALEIYNKPTIKYRVEGFALFVCNAWELMLKAKLLKDEKPIYYKDSNNTLSLPESLKRVITNKNSPLRKNINTINNLRNKSSHFITTDHESMYVQIFQRNVIDYIDKMKEYHGIDILNILPHGFIMLSAQVNVATDEEIRAKYAPEMAEKILSEKHQIEQEIQSSGDKFAIPIESKIFITKNKDEADWSVSVSRDADDSVVQVNKILDPRKTHPHFTNNVVNLVNKALKNENIKITKIKGEERINSILTTNDFQLFVKFYNAKNNPEYCFNWLNRFAYSDKFVNLIIEAVKKDPENIIENLKRSIEELKEK